VTTSFAQPDPATRRGPVATAAIGAIAVASVLTLLTVGVTFVGLAIAFPIAVPVAEAYHVPVSPADAALAERFASVWWVFAGFAIASFAATAVVIVKAIGFLSPVPRD